MKLSGLWLWGARENNSDFKKQCAIKPHTTHTYMLTGTQTLNTAVQNDTLRAFLNTAGMSVNKEHENNLKQNTGGRLEEFTTSSN